MDIVGTTNIFYNKNHYVINKETSNKEYKMNDKQNIKKELALANIRHEQWLMHGYDTPQYTYHEQLEMYELRIEILKKELESFEGEKK